ncbi:hypothetical protein [Mycolicibacterium sp.]|uniref:hypothetical protein n=1 Tax=Mycolicibacterium sp. TaxID=2320850 RepID=UPI003D12F340
MEWDLGWDDEVDVVCTDAGVAGLAAAIAAVEAGAEVFLADASVHQSLSAPLNQRGWFDPDTEHSESAAYLAELSADLDLAILRQVDPDLPIRLVRAHLAPAGKGVPPLFGSELRQWAARCIPSPSGYIYTRMADRISTATEAADGERFDVAEIGTMTPDPDDVAGSVTGWLWDRARDCGVVAESHIAFDHLVIAEGMVAGAAFRTADGQVTVRARHGVLLCRAGFPGGASTLAPGAVGAEFRVALVGKAASRFGRVELLTSDPAASVRT